MRFYKIVALSLAALVPLTSSFGIVPATVKLHDLDPQWRFVHGYWQGTCIDIDAYGDGGTPYTRHTIASTSGSEYSEQSIKVGDSSWTTDIRGELDYLQAGKTTVEFKSTTNGVLSRTTAAGNDNSLHTFFYDEGGVLTHSRLISFRETAGVMRRIVSTQSFTDGFAPSGLVQCKDVKLASQAAADEALASDSLPVTSAPELFAAVATADFIHPYAQCNATAVVLADYPQWADEDGYWMGEYSYFGPNLAPNHDPDRWNYPYDHYRGFITGSVDGGSYSQRNTFLYPPQTATRCTENNATYVADETCSLHGGAKLFQADQTTEFCNEKDGGRISGPYGADSTITTLIGTQAVLYQIWSSNSNGESVLSQSQMTTITHSSDGQIRRTRTAQFFDKNSGEAAQFSFYRELKVHESTFWTQFNATMVEYNVSPATIDKRCTGGFGNLEQFMEGSFDWDGDKYSCPLAPMPVVTGPQPLSVWTTTGVAGWAGFYPDDPVTAGLYLTAEKLAKVPGGTVAGLSSYGWIDILAVPSATWTAAGVTGWAAYYPSNPMTAGALLTAGQLAKVPGATVELLHGYGWVDTLTSPEAVWTTTGVAGWAGFYPDDPVTAGLYLTAEKLAKVPGGTVAGLSSYGWIDILAVPSATWTAAGVTGWAAYYPSNPMTAGALLTAGQLAKVPGATVELLHGYGWVDTLAL